MSTAAWRPVSLAVAADGLVLAAVPTVVVAGPADWQAAAQSDAARLRACIGRAAVELAAAMRSHRQ